jgi:hypothetical protein
MTLAPITERKSPDFQPATPPHASARIHVMGFLPAAPAPDPRGRADRSPGLGAAGARPGAPPTGVAGSAPPGTCPSTPPASEASGAHHRPRRPAAGSLARQNERILR